MQAYVLTMLGCFRVDSAAISIADLSGRDNPFAGTEAGMTYAHGSEESRCTSDQMYRGAWRCMIACSM